MSTLFEKDVDAYYQDKESYTKLLFNPSSRKPSDLHEKEKTNPNNGFQGFSVWPQKNKTDSAQSTSKADFEGMLDGRSLAEIQSAGDSMTKEGSSGTKAIPILGKR